jgi:hypothetical protein
VRCRTYCGSPVSGLPPFVVPVRGAQRGFASSRNFAPLCIAGHYQRTWMKIQVVKNSAAVLFSTSARYPNDCDVASLYCFRQEAVSGFASSLKARA